MHASRVTARVVSLMVVGAIACGSSSAPPLYKPGDKSGEDDGAGELARASVRLALGDDSPATFGAARPKSAAELTYGGSEYGGDPYGGAMYGGDPYGGVSYANWQMPALNYSAANRQPHYTPSSNLIGAVEGVVTWAGAAPAKVASVCGAIDNPTLRAGADKKLRGVIVYIEKVNIGRTMPPLPRPPSIGGIVAKRGCTLVPAAQPVTSLPATVSIHGDATRARVRVTVNGGAAKGYELQEGGLVEVELRSGVTRVDSEDGKISAAWLVAVDSPYYAVTDDAGRYRIDELAPGTYEVTFWQPPIASAGPDGVLTYGAPIVAHRSIKIDPAKPSQLNVALR
jgi:hypothetical protein